MGVWAEALRRPRLLWMGTWGGWGCGCHIHGKDLGVGCVGAEGANVLITGEDVSEMVGFEEAAWVDLSCVAWMKVWRMAIVSWAGGWLVLSWERRHSWMP